MQQKNSRPVRPWLRLDNAAKIFPPNSGKHDTNVFRFIAELNEPVRPDDLQFALERTLERFPFYLSVLRRGLFWPYFERVNFSPKVHREDKPICARLYDPNVKSLLFDVSYYHNRINLEVFHALSDGTGGMDFLRGLLCEYLLRRHRAELDRDSITDYDDSAPGWEDSFARHFEQSSPPKEPAKHRIAFQERSRKLPERRLNVLDAHLSVSEILARAKSYDVSLTVYLAAAMILAFGKVMGKKDIRRPVVLAIPVNLRNYFPSDSARNFFSLIHVEYRFSREEWQILSQNKDTEECKHIFLHLLSSVQEQFAAKLTQEKLAGSIHSMGQLERNPVLRAIPLFVKNFVLRIANEFAQLENSTTLSNLSVFQLPAFCTPYVRSVMALTSTDNSQICICSYQDVLSITFTSIYEQQEVRKHFLRFLTGEGLSVSIGVPPPLRRRRKGKSKRKQRKAKK